MKNKVINIDGTLIAKKSITAITVIKEDYSRAGALGFNPRGIFSFHIWYGGNTMSFSSSYGLDFFSVKPVSEVGRQLAFQEITDKRNEILKKLKIK
jgi:hypothetical protein